MYKFFCDQLVKSGIRRLSLNNFLARGSQCEGIPPLDFCFMEADDSLRSECGPCCVNARDLLRPVVQPYIGAPLTFNQTEPCRFFFFLLLHTLSEHAALSNVHVVSHNNIYNAA